MMSATLARAVATFTRAKKKRKKSLNIRDTALLICACCSLCLCCAVVILHAFTALQHRVLNARCGGATAMFKVFSLFERCMTLPVGTWSIGPVRIRHSSHDFGWQSSLLWISLGGKPKWLPLKFGYHDEMRTSPLRVNDRFAESTVMCTISQLRTLQSSERKVSFLATRPPMTVEFALLLCLLSVEFALPHAFSSFIPPIRYARASQEHGIRHWRERQV